VIIATSIFRPYLSMSLALSIKSVVRLPSGISLGEATVGHFEIGPLHNVLWKKG
jgi:hypothetical protein